MLVSHNSKKQKNKKRELKKEEDAKDGNGVFRVRMLDFSLESWEIRPSEVVGARRKVALRGETYAWASDLRSFNKLREVGVSPYLGFILYLSILLMFELNEAVRCRLIGPKSWDRIVIIFETQMVQPVTIHN